MENKIFYFLILRRFFNFDDILNFLISKLFYYAILIGAYKNSLGNLLD